MTAAVATAASNAFPPCWRISKPCLGCQGLTGGDDAVARQHFRASLGEPTGGPIPTDGGEILDGRLRAGGGL
jgi:hypothetical protein